MEPKCLPLGTTYGNATRDNGQFDLLNMRIGGPYKIKISFVGYATYVRNNVQLVLGKTFETRITLKEGEGQKLDEVLVKGNREGLFLPWRQPDVLYRHQPSQPLAGPGGRAPYLRLVASVNH